MAKLYNIFFILVWNWIINVNILQRTMVYTKYLNIKNKIVKLGSLNLIKNKLKSVSLKLVLKKIWT